MFEDTVVLEDGMGSNPLRPNGFEDYIGQEELVNKLKIAIEAANEREDALDHVLITGPPGLGKTSIAYVIAHECDISIRSLMAPSIKSTADLLETLVKLEDRSILFIDEIHALPKKTEEALYSAMEDFCICQKLPNKEYLNLAVPKFCLIGATTCPRENSTTIKR